MDENWSYTSAKNRNANYANLDFGTYTLLASNSDGVWNETPLRLKINITPPWWKTGIAIMLYVVFVLGLVGLAFYLQRRWFKLKRDLEITIIEEKKLEEIHQIRMQFFTNISHEFRTPLTLILTPMERLIQENLNRKEQEKYSTLFMKMRNDFSVLSMSLWILIGKNEMILNLL